VVIESIDWMREHRRIAIYAYCLMPDHLHILVRLPRGSRPLGELIGAFKRFTTRRSWALGITGALWQSRYHDHIVRESEDAVNIANYIVHNPGSKRVGCRSRRLPLERDARSDVTSSADEVDESAALRDRV
jgi:REP element-mobilizing transposase RayT